MVEHVHYDKNGQMQNVEVYAYPVFNQKGDLVQMIEYSIDITDRKQAQAELAAEKEQLSVTLRSIGDGVITTDTSGRIILLNKVAETLTGWSNEEAVGRPLEEVFHIINEQTKAVCENPVKKVLHSGQIVGLANHTALVTKNGRKIRIADSGAPILDVQSKIIGVVLVFRDVTEQIKAEKELLKMKKLESVGVLAGGIAHDFNNILASILGNINLSLFDESLQERTKNPLSEAEKASLRAKDLTQQLLTFSKGGDPVKQTASLDKVIQDSANFVLHGDKVACQYNIPEDLWLVDVDKGQISQVIQNIVLNASHAMPEGGIIAISCENLSSVDKKTMARGKRDKFIKISIQDNGIGIPQKLIDKIFDPYFSTKQEGSGLGLAICQSIISKHNGDIFVESSPGEGTTLTIYLPASDKPQPHPQEKIEDYKIASQAKILIMDDDEMVRNVAKAMLTKLGNEVILSEHGAEAVILYQEAMNSGNSIQLVIMDLTIPGGMGGKDAVQEIHKLNPEAKVIVSSGYSNDPIMANFKDHGFCAAIAKPFQLQELSRVLSQVLG
jgi:PAS domain S-box-containing protein